MNLEFDKSFAKNLEKIKDKSIQKKLIKIIELVENANSISEIANTKKLVGYFSYYRIKLGNYRIGFEKMDESTIRFIIICHRKDIYTKIP